jgi:hypothetical protein
LLRSSMWYITGTLPYLIAVFGLTFVSAYILHGCGRMRDNFLRRNR